MPSLGQHLKEGREYCDYLYYNINLFVVINHVQIMDVKSYRRNYLHSTY